MYTMEEDKCFCLEKLHLLHQTDTAPIQLNSEWHTTMEICLSHYSKQTDCDSQINVKRLTKFNYSHK